MMRHSLHDARSQFSGSVMECLDCWADGQHRLAVGVCRVCGACVCRQHAFIGAPLPPPAPLMVTPGPGTTPGRIVRCAACEAATRGPLTDRALQQLLDDPRQRGWLPRPWRARHRTDLSRDRDLGRQP
jgi:hypothetical protein